MKSADAFHYALTELLRVVTCYYDGFITKDVCRVLAYPHAYRCIAEVDRMNPRERLAICIERPEAGLVFTLSQKPLEPEYSI